MKKTISRPLAAAILTACLALFFSCKKTDFSNLQPTEHESEWAVPLFKTSIGIEDLLQKTLVDTAAKLLIAPDGKMTFYYQGDLAEKYATELFTFFDQLPPIPIQFPNTEILVPLEAPSSLHIRKVLLKAGKFVGGAVNLTTETIKVRIIVDEMTKDGVPFNYEFQCPPTGAGYYLSPDSLDVAGYFLESANDTIRVHYEAFLPDGSPTLMFAVGLYGFGLKFKYVEGFWESTTYPLTDDGQPDTIPIDIYSFVAGAGKIQFDDPRVTAYILNSFGFPTAAKINEMKVVLKDGSELNFDGQSVVNDISANYPSLQEIGQTKVTEFYFDKNNSNIKEIFNTQPVALIYDFDGISNPDNNPDFIGFITDESRVQLRVRVELPLRAYAKDFVVQDTLDVDFGGYGTLDAGKVREAEFKIITENEMPVGLSTQIIFLDGQNQSIDSLFENEAIFLGPAEVDADGNVTAKTVLPPIFVTMDAARFERVRGATHIVLRARFNTSGGPTQPVTALQKQRTSIRMGLKVTLFD